MNVNPLISIVLPVYNGEKYLALALDGVINQTYKNFELIIVNDCSKDSTLQIAQSYAIRDPRIKIISNEKNKKLPGSLNIGFRHAQGEFHTWTSDDNIHHPNCLERLLYHLINTQSDLVYSDYNIIDNNGEFAATNKMGPTEGLIYVNTVGASFLYKKEIFEKLKGYSENLFLIEDYDFWARAVINGFKLKHIDEILYNYRVHPDSLSSTTRSMPVLIPYLKKNLEIYPKVDRDLYFKAHTNLLFNARNILPKYELVTFYLKMLFRFPIRTTLATLTRYNKMLFFKN